MFIDDNDHPSQINTSFVRNHSDLDFIEDRGQFFIDYNFIENFKPLWVANDNAQEIILTRGITKLVHFTPEANLRNIKALGLIPRSELESIGFPFEYNDNGQYTSKFDGISLSVQFHNSPLLRRFRSIYPGRKYVMLTIAPSILYTSFIKENGFLYLVKRHYCDYNAAASYTTLSEDDMNIMFPNEVNILTATNDLKFDRHNKATNETTAIQAEILFFGRIPPEYIINIEEV